MTKIGTFPIEAGNDLSDAEVGLFIRRGVKSWNKLAQIPYQDLSKNLDVPLLVRVRKGLQKRKFPVWTEDSWNLLDDHILSRLRANNVTTIWELAHLPVKDMQAIFRNSDTRKKLEYCLTLSDLCFRPDIPELPEKLTSVSQLADRSPQELAKRLNISPSLAGRRIKQLQQYEQDLAYARAALDDWGKAIQSYETRYLRLQGASS